jgi:thiosulfate reductase/polysulfide reductase chain A
MAGAAGLASVQSRLLAGFEDWFQPATPALGEQTLITSCGICDSVCAIRATVKDGVLRFLEGLPGDFQGRGKLCGKGTAGAGFLYDPDRLKYPMRRTNPRKGLDQDPGFVRISWQEALDTIADRIKFYTARFGAESLLFITRPAPDLWVRFMKALGVVNRVDHRDECYQTDIVVQKYTTGGKSWCNDFDNSRYLLLFGFDLLTKTKLVYSHGILAAKERGAKIVFFSPHYNTTARIADEWYPIRPGSDLAVALAMIHVIVTENLFNQEFVDQFTNFRQYEKEIRAHFAQYTPEWAEGLSDVPAEAIRRIAREFATQGPGIVPLHKKSLAANYMNATQLAHAISILNILAGTVDRPGGRYFPRTVSIPGVDAIYPPPAYPKPVGRRVDGTDKLPLVREVDSGSFSTLADGMLKKYPGMIKFAFFNMYTVLGFPLPTQMEEALKTVEFTVVMDTLPTDTALLADIVLPSITYLEASDLVPREFNAKMPQVVVRQPVVAPMFEAKSIGWVAIELGKRVVPDYFRTPNGDWINPAALLDEKVKGAGLGSSFAEFKSVGIYTKEQPFTPRTTFATPSGKCQIYVPEFAAKGYDPLPVWKPKAEQPSADYPYYYVTFIPAIHRRNSTQNNPILHEMMPTNAAIISRTLAERLGIREGQMVRIRSRVGAIELPAHITETLRPDCVMVAHGFGHRSRLLSLAAGKGVRDGDVIPSRTVEEFVAAGNFGGAACIMDAVVNIEPL